jgi:AcrR family transcriptional regulator
MARKPSSVPIRQRLNRSKVLAAAVALADSGGIEAISMRHLADALDVVPMALYKHVADKEDLLDGMVDVVIGEFCPFSVITVDTTWQQAVTQTLLAARASVLAHPWARQVIETRTRRTSAVLGHMEQVARRFLNGGFSADLTHHAMHALGNRIWGFSPELFNDAGRAEPPAGVLPDPADFPAIVAIAADSRQRRPDAISCDEEFEFEFALDLLLGGLERLRVNGWTSVAMRRSSTVR